MFHSLTGRRNKSDHSSFLRTMFGANLWQRRGWIWLLGIFLSIIWFDIEWCMATTFTSFSRAETYVNSLLMAMIIALPAMLWHCHRLSFILLLALDIWLECNLLYSRTYFNAIPLSSYSLISNLSDFTSSVTDSIRWLDLGFLIILLFTTLLSGGRNNKVSGRSRIAYLCFLLIIFVTSGVLLLNRGGLRKAWIDLEDCYHFSCRVPMFTIAGSLINDAIAEHSGISQQERETVWEWIDSHGMIQALPDSVGKQIDNVVVILCESLESWPINLTLEGKEITPVLNSLVADTVNNLYAPHVLTQVGSGRSIDAQLLINAGMLPMLGGVYSMKAPFNTYYTIPKAMKELKGAKSYLMSVDKPVVWNQGAVASSFGFDTLLMKDAWRIDETAGGYRLKLGDRSFLRQIAEKASDGVIWPEGEKAFLQIITYSGHNPFNLPDELDNLNLTGKYPEVARNYLRTAHYTDEGIGILLDYLQTRNDFDRTLIVITGDHEGLADYRKNLAEQLPYVSRNKHTPLIIVNSPVGGHIEKLIGQIDIYPTILQLAGLTDYRWKGLGREITSPEYLGAAVNPNGIIEGDTTNISGEHVSHLLDSRQISDRIIRFDLLHDLEAHRRPE